MSKLVFIDIDGTLVKNRQKFLPKASLSCLQELLNNNIKIALTSGRALEHILPMANQINGNLQQKGFLLSAYNGSLIYDYQTKKNVFESLVNPLLTNKIEKIARKNKVNCIAYSRKNEKTIITAKRSGFLAKKLSKITGLELSIIEDSELFPPTYKVLMISLSKDKLNSCENALSKINSEVEFSRTTSFLLEITNCGINKGSAGKIICEQLGISLKECIAIGDSMNDLPLMRIVGFAVAMGNASPEVKKIAGVTIETQKEEGIVNFFNNQFQKGVINEQTTN